MSHPQNQAQPVRQSWTALDSAQPAQGSARFQQRSGAPDASRFRTASALPTAPTLGSGQVMHLHDALAAVGGGSPSQRATHWLNKTVQHLIDDGLPPAGSALATAQGPLVGIIDNGFAEGQHGHAMLQTIRQGSPDATILLADSVGKGTWAQDLTRFVDVAKASGQSQAVVNLSFDLTQKNPDGSITTRNELTASERDALLYAQQNGVLVVTSAGNNGGAMSALEQASGRSDNLIVVGAAEGGQRAAYSSYGSGLDLMVNMAGNPIGGTSQAAAETTKTITELWAKHPNLAAHQVVQVLEASSVDLGNSGWDSGTGLGLLNPRDTLSFDPAALSAGAWQAGLGPVQSPGQIWAGQEGAIATERSNFNLRRAAAAVGRNLRPSRRQRPRGSGLATAVRRGAGALRRNLKPPSRQRPRGSGLATAVRRGAGALRRNLQPPSRQRPRGSGLATAVRRGAGALRRNLQPSSRQRPRGSGLATAVRRGAGALRRSLQPPQRRPVGGSSIISAFRGGTTALRRHLQLPGGRSPRVSQLAGAIAGGGATALRRHLQLPGRPNPRGSALAGAIAGSAIALGGRLPLPGRPLTGGFRAGGAIARAQEAIRQIRQSPLSPSPFRGLFGSSLRPSGLAGRLPRSAGAGSFNFRQSRASLTGHSIPGIPIITGLIQPSDLIGNPRNLFRDQEAIDAARKFYSLDASVMERFEAYNTGLDKMDEHLGAFGTAVNFTGDLGVGINEGLASAVTDIWETGKSTWNAVRNPTQAINDLTTTARAIREDPQGAGREMWNSFTQPYVDDWRDGQYGQAIGRGALEVASLFIPGGAGVGARVLRTLSRLPDTPNGSNPPGGAPSPGGRAPGSETPGGPSGHGPDAPNPPGGAPGPGSVAPEPRPAPPPPTGSNGRGPGSGSSPGGSEPLTPAGSPVNPPRPRPNPPAQDPPPAPGLPSPHPVDPSSRANPGGGGPRTQLHGRTPSDRDSNEVPVLVGDRTPSGPQNFDTPAPRSGGSGRNEDIPNHPELPVNPHIGGNTGGGIGNPGLGQGRGGGGPQIPQGRDNNIHLHHIRTPPTGMRQPDFYVDLTTLSGNQIRQVWGRHSARQLARNMGLGGVPRPPGNGLPLAGGNMAWAAHHIVPGNLNQVLFRGTFPPNPMQRHGHIPSVIAARTRLADLGVRVNDSDNGVWLPQVRQGRANRVPGTTIHNHVHTPRYFDEVWNRLQGAQTEGQARATLQQIAQELALGIFPY